MFRLLSITILLILPLQSIASISYVVRLAVYKNADSLQQELNKLSPALKKTIEVQKRGDDNVACSMQTEDKKSLQKLLPSYKKVFPDAFISAYQETETAPTKREIPSTKTEKSLPRLMQKTDTVTYSRKISNPTKKDIPFYDRIKQKTLYLCAYGEEEWSPNVLIHVAFFDKEVIYTPIMGDALPKREKYTVDDNKLYISQKGLFDSEIYSTLESVTEHYYLISTWVGKSKINTIRYYFDLDNAEEYVTSLK
ncbi:MAG: hypothetical protein OQK45_07965 [Sulfurovum sp.]|nr:hypothetical protein [Sulfurovum sp.]